VFAQLKVPKGSNRSGAILQKILNILAECIPFFALDVDRPNDNLSRSIKDRNDDLGGSGAKRRQVTGIG